MAEPQKKDPSSGSLKEKDSLLDLDIGKDFFSSWKPMEGDIDFDMAPVSKGNKKSFNFDKADMDFNLDGDFGNIPSFNMDMSDLDISPPLKKDGKSKMDMSDLDISPPLKKDGKSKEKSKESSSGEDNGKKGKTDGFAFSFDFDELENFNFDSSLTKESPKGQKEKNDKESSSSGSGLQDKESSLQMNQIENLSTSEDEPQKPSLPGTVNTFDKNFVVGGSADLEPTGKNCPFNLAMDDAVTSGNSAAIDEVGSDIAKIPPETTIAPMELPKVSPSEKLVSSKSVDHEACQKNDHVQELPADYLCDNKPSGGNSTESPENVGSIDTNATDSNREQNVNETSITASTCNYQKTVSEIPQHLQTVEVSEEKSSEKSHVGTEDHVTDNRGRTELGQINSAAETSSTSSTVSGIICDTPSGADNQELAPKIHKLQLVRKDYIISLYIPKSCAEGTSANLCSQPVDLSKKETENVREPRVTVSRSSMHSDKPECPAPKAPPQTTFSSLSSQKVGITQPSLVEGRRERDSIQSDKKLLTLPSQLSKTPLRKELPQIQRQESCKALDISREVCAADGLKNGKILIDTSITQSEMAKAKSVLMQREMSTKDLNTPSMEVKQKAAGKSGNSTTLASIPITKSTPGDVHKLSSTEGINKTLDLPGLKLSGLTLDSTKFSIQKDIKSAGKIGQNRVLLRKTPPSHFPESQLQTPSTLSMKRKAVEENAAEATSLHPPKRLSPLSNPSRSYTETSEKKVPEKKNNMDDDRTKGTIGKSLVSTVHSPREVTIKGVEISSSVENDNNIKPAEAYSKELDDLCYMLRKKNDEAKEILVKAIVNSNKLLLLNNPLLDEKIRATQNLFAGLTLENVHG